MRFTEEEEEDAAEAASHIYLLNWKVSVWTAMKQKQAPATRVPGCLYCHPPTCLDVPRLGDPEKEDGAAAVNHVFLFRW